MATSGTSKKSAFVVAMASSKTVGKALQAAKKAKDDNKPSEIKAGAYVAQLTRILSSTVLVNKAPKPIVYLTLVVKGGDYDGEVLRHKYPLFGEKGNGWERTENEAYERFSVFMQRMDKEVDWDTPQDVEDLIQELAKEKPLVAISVKRNPANNWPQIYVNGLAEEDDESPETDDTEDDDDSGDDDAETETDEDGDDSGDDNDDGDTADDAEDGDDEGEDSDDDEGDEEEVVIVKKDQVYYKPINGKKKVLCNVTASNKNKKTCDLIDPTTKKTYKGIDWDAVEAISS